MSFWADIIALLAATCWAGANTCIARGSSHQGGENGAFLSILLTAFIAGVVWLIGGGTDGQALNTEGLAWFVAAGALTIFVGRVFFQKREAVNRYAVAAAALGVLGTGVIIGGSA